MADGYLSGMTLYLQNKCSDHVVDAGKPDGHICQWTEKGLSQQKFKLVHVEGNQYNIISEKDGKAIDLQDYNIIKWDFHGGKNQQWNFEAVGDGGFLIESAMSDEYVIEVPDSSCAVGCNLRLWRKEGGANQIFRCKKMDGTIPCPHNPNSELRNVILRSQWTKQVLDASKCSNLCQMKINHSMAQKFKIQPVEDSGRYYVISELDGKAVAVAESDNKDEAEIILEDFSGDPNQQWIFHSNSNRRWVIETALGGRTLDVPHAWEGCNLILWPRHEGKNQLFSLEHSPMPLASDD